jgi:hypothetical protein
LQRFTPFRAQQRKLKQVVVLACPVRGLPQPPFLDKSKPTQQGNGPFVIGMSLRLDSALARLAHGHGVDNTLEFRAGEPVSGS